MGAENTTQKTGKREKETLHQRPVPFQDDPTACACACACACAYRVVLCANVLCAVYAPCALCALCALCNSGTRESRTCTSSGCLKPAAG